MPDSTDALAVLLVLLPGLVGLLVFTNLAVDGERDPLDRIVIALVLSMLAGVVTDLTLSVSAIHAAAKESVPSLLDHYSSPATLARTCVAVAMSAAAAVAQNRGWIYGIARLIGLTPRTGRIDVWHEVFAGLPDEGRWVHLLFKDGKRLLGAPESYSLTGREPSIFLADARWYIPRESGEKSEEVLGDGVLVTNFEEVLAVEVLY